MAVLVSRYFFLQSFIDIEEVEISLMLDRAQAIIADDLDQLEIIVRDWAVWDDTYDFVLNGNQSYIISNLQESTFQGLGLSGFYILDADHILVFGYESDQGLGKAIITAYSATGPNQPDPVQGQDSQHDTASKHLVPANDYLHLAVGKSIQPTEGLVPGSGLLVMVRALDEERAARYSRLMGVPVTISMSEKGQSSFKLLKKTNDFITASQGLHSGSGDQAGILSIELPRTISKHGARSLSIYLVSVTATLAAIALGSLLILESLVFRQLRAIGGQLKHIASGTDPSARVQIQQGDEIGLLADMMNRSLDALQTRIQERETMLREIHHRVKNNLQIIASLLNLQSAEASTPSSSHALNEGRRRVLAMAFIHDELYGGTNLSAIDLVRFLDGFIRFFEPEGTCYGAISRSLIAKNITIDIDQAVPLGLVLSEALANCYQHAFPDGKDGSIIIEAKAEGEAGIVLEVRDNGIGLESKGYHRSGLGLSLIEALADQLHGRVSLTTPPEGGTILSLSFPHGGSKRHGQKPS